MWNCLCLYPDTHWSVRWNFLFWHSFHCPPRQLGWSTRTHRVSSHLVISTQTTRQVLRPQLRNFETNLLRSFCDSKIWLWKDGQCHVNYLPVFIIRISKLQSDPLHLIMLILRFNIYSKILKADFLYIYSDIKIAIFNV